MTWKTKIIPNNGWNAGARTVANLVADGLAQFEVSQAGGIICGLNDVDTGADYRELDHALWIEWSRVKVVEGGIEKTGWTSFTLGATFGIERVAGVVRYYADSTLLYTSTIASTGTVFLDCSLYLAGDTILDARITDYFSAGIDPSLPPPDEDDPTPRGGFRLSPLSAFGTDRTDDYGLIVLSGLTVVNEDIPDPIELSPLAALGADNSFGFISLSPLALVNDELLPDINYGAIELSPLQLLVADMSASWEAAITLSSIECFGTDTDGIGFVELSQLEVDATALIDNFFVIEMPFFTGRTLNNTLHLHEVDYGVTTSNLHRVSYEGTSTVLGLHQTTYAQAAQSLHDSSWASSLTNTAQSLHDSIYATISIYPTLGIHQTSWASAGLLNTATGLHETGWASAGSLQTVAALHQSSWESTGSLNTVFGLHDASWTVSWAALGLHQSSYQSTSETFGLHAVRYESVPDTILALHECRYRSNQTTPVILTGLIYARI